MHRRRWGSLPLSRVLPVLPAAGVPIIWLTWSNRPDKANIEPPVLPVFKKKGNDAGIGKPVPGGTPVDKVHISG